MIARRGGILSIGMFRVGKFRLRGPMIAGDPPGRCARYITMTRVPDCRAADPL
jgi:hypothetical protein